VRHSWRVVLVLLAACGIDSPGSSSGQPSITRASVVAARGGVLTLEGRGFGATQGERLVRIGAVPASESVSWKDTQVQVRVPRATPLGPVDVVMSVDGQEATATTLAVLAQPLGAGLYHSVVLKADGTVAAWGDSGDGQTTIPPALSDVVSIVASTGSLALKADGTLAAWGTGSGAVPSGLSGVAAIAAGGFHQLVLMGDGTGVAWGNNDRGQTTVPEGLVALVGRARYPFGQRRAAGGCRPA
jgi:alpha-tubulin suppressor-like RCC1 family protein